MATLGRRKKNWSILLKGIVTMLIVGVVADVILDARGERNNPFIDGIVVLGAPFMRLGAAVHQGAEAGWLAIFAMEDLRSENEELRRQMAEARLEWARARSTESLDRLVMDVSTNVPPGGYDVIPVQVLSVSATGGKHTAWINAGEASGIEQGMVVLGPHGIAGEIESVHGDVALVEFITDERAVWGGEILGRGEIGLIRGTGDPRFVLFEFNETATFADVTDTVVSSGMAGSLAPAGITFGKIQEVRTNKEGEPTALVRLPEEPTRMRTLFVLPQERIPFSVGVAKP